MNYLLLIVTILLSSSLQAQEMLPTSHPAYKRCMLVYDKLKKAIGDNRSSLPHLMVLDRKKRVASYRSMDNVFIIEKPAYDICEKMGKDFESALAFLIGHELTHFYQQTDWNRKGLATHFLLKYEVLKKYSLEDEEADSYSAFVAYLADFKTLEIIPTLFEKIYEGYSLDNNLEGYPTLEERKKVVRIVQRKVRKFIQMYESANYYVAIGWNLQAISCYGYLLKFIKTKELYHNIGVVLLATAIQNPEREGYSFLYPIDVDLTNVFQRSYTVYGGRKKFLTDAEGYLREALILDKKYCSAYLNLSCVYDLKGEVNNALATLEVASNLSPTSLQRAKIAIIKGIVSAHRNQIKTASDYFDAANKHYKNLPIWYISNANKQLLVNEKKPRETYDIEVEDRIDEVDFLSKRKKTSAAIPLGASNVLNMEVDFSTEARSYFSRFLIENKLEHNDSYVFLQRTKNKEVTTKRNIKVGDELVTVQKAYKGLYFQVVHHNKGFFLVYPSKGLIFQINLNNKVKEWGVFSEY